MARLKLRPFKPIFEYALAFVEIFFGNVILGNFMGVHFFLFSVVGFLHACDDSGLEHVSFLYQLLDTFRIHIFAPGKSLQIS